MSRTPLNGITALTPAERMRRYRSKLRSEQTLHCAERVLATLKSDYRGASATDRQMIRKGVARLLKRWDKVAAREQAFWRRRASARRSSARNGKRRAAAAATR
jgi:hypothetical protein